MKECRYCGTKYDDSLDICPNCGGNKVITEEERAEEAALRQKEAENQERAAAAPVKKKNTIIGVIVAVVVVIAAIAGFSIYKANQPLSNGMTKDEAQGVFDSGVAFMDAGQYEDAIDTFLQLPSDSKKYAEAQELIAQSQDSYRADIVSRVDGQIANGDFTAAFDLVEKAQTILPGDAELQGSYDNICTAYRADILSRVDSQVASGNYESAFSLIEEGQNVLPGDAELQGAYDNTYSAYRTAVLTKADEYSQGGQYKMALEYLSGVQTTFSDDTQVQDAYDNINLAYKEQIRTTAIADADNYVANADYVSAINTLNSAISEIGQNGELDAKLAVYTNEYVATITSTAQGQYKKYNAESIYAAEKMISNALEILPNNQELLLALDYYQELEPIRIIAMPAADEGYSGGVFATMESAKDTAGNIYSDVIYVESFNFNAHDDDSQWWWYCSKDIDLDFQYSKITGVLFQNEEYAEASTQTKIIIQGFPGGYSLNNYRDNGYSLWTGQVSGNSDAKYFDVDVTGMQYVSIQFQGDDSVGSESDAYHYAYLAQLYLWK